MGETCGNLCARIRGSPRVFAVIVTQLVTQRWECLDIYLPIQSSGAHSSQGNFRRTYAFACGCGICLA